MAKAQAQEPSMEEILASIRRIIADEDPAPSSKPPAPAAAAAPPAPPKAAAPAPVPPPAPAVVSEDDLDKLFGSDADEDVLELGDSDVAMPAAAKFVDHVADIAFEPAAPKPEPARPAAVKPEPVRFSAPESKPAPRYAPPPQSDPESRRDPLLSDATDSKVSAAFDNLALTILNKNSRTVEDLIEDLLRPMLKSWLDDNLPAMVERLIRAEIERVARGR